MSSDQSLATFILGGKQQAFTSYKETQSLVLNKATVVTNERDGGEFALVELTDGHHWVPAIASIPVLEDGLGGQDFISQLDALRNTTMVLNDTVIGVHKRQDAFGIHLMILGCTFTRTTASFESIDPDDISFEPSVSQWLIDLRKTFTGTPDSEWFCNLFPDSATDEYEEILNEYCIVHGDLEKILLMQYGELPALHLRAEKEENGSKGIKRQRSAMNEEDPTPMKQPSTIAESSTTHKRQRHTSPKAPVEPNKLARLEQSDVTLKNANAAVMELWNKPLSIRELHKRDRGNQVKPAEDTPSITVNNDRPSSPPQPPPPAATSTSTAPKTDNTPTPITDTTPAPMTDITPTHTTTEDIQKEDAKAQPSLPDVNKDDNAATLNDDEGDDDDDEAQFYEPMPEDPSAQKSLLRSLYVSMAKKFNIPSPT
ncbi:hypothetical protein O0I10_002632 [Lichtheimia ornata]|uniref:Uncharacterized protein n=1 Tax=Lichtheimia ornata TaxID=688661 RepID=A0AAD7Y213_9FUNG|nr:uncharacterized protein O0I10_002632 [Lichtheimia ornata]KAJ8661823.1 hypothetical protein O0I10_002632 [Lichtheimia ornata]